MKNCIIGATEFKAKCLALLDEVEDQGATITVTKRGRPVATIAPAKKKAWKSPKGIPELLGAHLAQSLITLHVYLACAFALDVLSR